MELHRRTWLHVAALISIFVIGAQQSALSIQPTHAQSEEPDNAFTESAASRLLSQVAEGLQGHMARKLLAAFDLSGMDDGAIFKEQVTSFFNQADTIRVHFKLLEVKGNTVTVNAQMEVTLHSSINPPQHKSAQLRFTAEQTPSGWKFVDVQPRAFFS